MVDLSKHLARAKQSLDRRQYDYVLEQMEECLDLDPANLDVHRMLLDAARKRAKEGSKTSFFAAIGGLTAGLGKDAHKALIAHCKRMGKNPEPKIIAEVGDAALKMAQGGVKTMTDVAIYYYDEFLASGLFNEKVLWSLANVLENRYRETKDNAALDRAIKLLKDLEKANPQHAEASRTIKNWEALRSMSTRSQAAGGDYRSQLASGSEAKRAEAMNRIIRTLEDAKEVLGYVDEDLVKAPTDKSLWVKKGDIHRRINQTAEAKAAYAKAQSLDPHDFTLTMRLGDIAMDEAKAKAEAAIAAGADPAVAKTERLQVEIAEYRKRIERQPTDLGHRYNLGIRLLQVNDIDGAAAEFQKSVGDPKAKRSSHRYLGYCFAKKNLLDLACQQYTSYLSLAEDDTADEAKEVRYLRARVLEDLGKRDEAIKDYERNVAIDLNYKDAATRLSTLRGGG